MLLIFERPGRYCVDIEQYQLSLAKHMAIKAEMLTKGKQLNREEYLKQLSENRRNELLNLNNGSAIDSAMADDLWYEPIPPIEDEIILIRDEFGNIVCEAVRESHCY